MYGISTHLVSHQLTYLPGFSSAVISMRHDAVVRRHRDGCKEVKEDLLITRLERLNHIRHLRRPYIS